MVGRVGSSPWATIVQILQFAVRIVVGAVPISLNKLQAKIDG